MVVVALVLKVVMNAIDLKLIEGFCFYYERTGLIVESLSRMKIDT